MTSRQKIRLGDLLVENEVISQRQLEEALSQQKKCGRKLGRVLIDSGYIEESNLLEFLSRQLAIPYVDIKTYPFDPGTVRLIPEMQARRYRAIALDAREPEVLIGMADPTDIFGYDELARLLRRPVKLAVVSEADLLNAFDSLYRRTEEIEGFAEQLNEELSERDIDLGQLVHSDQATDAPVVKLIQSLFEDAVQVNASDVHIEPDESVLRIRLRVDGMLQERVMDERRIASALVLRLKLMAGLDIAEKRLPQDGRFSARIKGRVIDVRMSTMPVQHGESVVMRLLDQSSGPLSLDQLGMGAELRDRFERAIFKPHGMVLVTGPTGSGKTTTLYAALNVLNRPETKIITVEDPVEYRQPRINQVQVRAEIGLTFARVLRSVLRQDPDVVLVGEMRDEETVEIGLRAALTGHLVLSTLHTNDAASTVNRLLDMKAKGYLLACALEAVLAQRLARRVCGGCMESYQPEGLQLAWLESRIGPAAARARLKRGVGCSHCNGTGYRGRLGVHEMLEIDQELEMVLSDGDSRQFAALAGVRLAGRSLVNASVAHAMQGATTLDEVMRIAGGGPESPQEGDSPLPSASSGESVGLVRHSAEVLSGA